MKYVQWFLIAVMSVLCIILLCAIVLQEPQPKVTEYKPNSTSTVKKEQDDDCTYTMCNAFGGGIAGDTLAIQFMNGD